MATNNGRLSIQAIIDRNRATYPPQLSAWQIVRRKKGYPDWWRPGPVLSPADLPRSKVYIPYQIYPTYAELAARWASQLVPTATHANRLTTKTSSPATSPPTSPQSPTYYLSPHSPTPLRFPPSPKFGEWKGRCFRCCQVGHAIAVYRNPSKCGRCWKNGHTGTNCRAQETKQAPAPTTVPTFERPREKEEPGFADLLLTNKSLNPPPMPTNRPAKIRVYVDRDLEYHHEVNRLKQAVVVHATDIAINFELCIDKVT